MIPHMNNVMTCSLISLMQKLANSWTQMDCILCVWLPNSTQMIIRPSRKSCAWTKKLGMNGLTQWMRNSKTCSNQEPLSLSVESKCSNRARKLFEQHGPFGRNVVLPEKSTNSRHVCVFAEIFNAKIVQTTKLLPQQWNGQ